NHTARVAGSGPLDPGTDTLVGNPVLSWPIPVTRLAQLPDGLRAATVLAARTVPTASELRKLAAAHADLAHTCGRLLPNQLTELKDSYTDRAAAYTDLAGAASRVASIHRGRGGLVLVQTAELTRLLHHATATSPRDVVAGVLADLDTAYPVFSAAMAGRVTHGLRFGAYLVPHPHTLEHRWEHARPGHPAAARLHQAATRLKVGDRTADQRAADHAASLRRPGRPPALTPDQVITARQLLHDGDRTQRQVADHLGVGLSTLKRALHATAAPGDHADDVHNDRAGTTDPPPTPTRGALTTTVLRQARELTGCGHTLLQVADQLQVGVDTLRAALRDPTEPCSPVADPARHALAAALAGQPVSRRPVTPGHPVPTGRTIPPPARQQP
ncbi:MAG TPA: helix-turn-helix domain-containing protein, partial [Actinomycetota bacterium]|nr:helix-turn-helix domain-containing protein [Actinomycetota bacterium]